MPRSPRGAIRRLTKRKPPLTLEALWQIKRIGTPTLSPSGTLACAAVTSYAMEKNDGSTSLWLFPTGLGDARRNGSGRARKLTAGDKDSDPKWSPDGRWIAFTAKRKDDDEPQLYVIAPDGGEARRLARVATGCAAPKWFPDGKRIAFVSWVWPDLATEALQAKRKKERKDAKVKAHVTERQEFRFWDHWLTDGREPHIFVCDVATGRCHDALARTGLSLPPWEPSADDFDIAPDGREIAITADLAPEPQMMNQTDIVTVDLSSRRKRVLTAGTQPLTPSPATRPTGARSSSTPTTRSARSTIRVIWCWLRAVAARCAGLRRSSTAQPVTSRGHPTAARCCSLSKAAGGRASHDWRWAMARCRRLSSRAAWWAASRSRATAACLRSIARRREARPRSSLLAPTAATNARSKR